MLSGLRIRLLSDLYISKSTTWEEIAKSKGYSIKQADNDRWMWFCNNQPDDDYGDPQFEDEEDAWKDCCIHHEMVS